MIYDCGYLNGLIGGIIVYRNFVSKPFEVTFISLKEAYLLKTEQNLILAISNNQGLDYIYN